MCIDHPFQGLPIIDFHAHAFPEAIAQPAVDQLSRHYKLTVKRTGTLADLLDSAEAAGVKGICLHAAATNSDQVEKTNSWIAQNCNHMIFGFGSIHVDYLNYQNELDRMKKLGLTGVKLHADFQGFAIDDPLMWPVYEAIGDQFLTMFHVGDRESDLSNPVRLSRVLNNFPKMKVIAAHLGGWSKWQEARDYILGRDVYIDTSSTTWCLPPKEIASLIKRHDINRVLFGTDYPIVSHIDELRAFSFIPLSTEETEKILYKNACKLLRLND